MTSKITDVYNRIIVVLDTLFPSKTRIPYPYSIERNNSRLMIDGYGLLVGSSTFEELEWCGFLNSRSIGVVFTRSLFKVDSSTLETDNLIKAMLEDVYTVQESFYNYNELDIPAKIARVDITDVSEPEEVNAENSSFLSMTANFNFFIYEKFKENTP